MSLGTSIKAATQRANYTKEYSVRECTLGACIFLTLLLPRSSIDDLVFSMFPPNFLKSSYKITLLKNGFLTLISHLIFIKFSKDHA